MITLGSVLLSLFVGAVAGWLAGEIVKGSGFGLFTNILLGLIGGLVGGLILGIFGITGYGIIGNTLVSTFGAVVLIFVARALFPRRLA